MTSTLETLAQCASLDALYALLAPRAMLAGWNKPTPSLYAEPYKTFLPAVWSYADGHAALEAAGRLIDTALAERRNLILVNPLEGNAYGTARTLVAAYQAILPGERARSHRHSPNALRLIVDAEPGTYTVVDGARIEMLPNDIVLTPHGSWHGHGNDSSSPAYWIDFLDVPLVQLLEPMFFEPYRGGEPEERPVTTSPLLFSWRDVEPRLRAAETDPRGRFGRRLTLEHSMRTFGLHVLAIDAPTTPFRTTANNLYAVIAGSGSTVVDGVELRWSRGDVLVAPAWRAHQHRPDREAVLFQVTDEPVLAALDLLVESA